MENNNQLWDFLSAGCNVHFDKSGSVDAIPRPLANDLCRVDEVLKYLLMHAGEGAAERPELLALGGIAGRFGDDPSLSDEDNMAVGELLLHLSSEPVL